MSEKPDALCVVDVGTAHGQGACGPQRLQHQPLIRRDELIDAAVEPLAHGTRKCSVLVGCQMLEQPLRTSHARCKKGVQARHSADKQGYLHTRVGGKQVKRSLRTSYKRVAIIRAITLLDSLMRKDLPQKYELDLSRGILKANDDADHARLMQALQAMQQLQQAQPQAPAPIAAPVQADDPTALKLAELLEKFLLLKKVTQATAIAYKNCIEEISKFLKNPAITRITASVVSQK